MTKAWRRMFTSLNKMLGLVWRKLVLTNITEKKVVKIPHVHKACVLKHTQV